MTISELELAVKKVEQLVTITNCKINELGNHTDYLYRLLEINQNQFDKIRNLPADKELEYKKLKEVRLGWKNLVDKIESDYKNAQDVHVRSGAAAATFGVGVVAFGPSVAMGIVTTFGYASTGAAISGLSGAAATNAALAVLGGGTLATGGGGMAAGSALLALAGPVGWTIFGLSILGSGYFFWKTKSDKDKLEKLFLLISERDQKKYQRSIIEISERIQRIIDAESKLSKAIVTIETYGLDYSSMTEEQQYNLGSYFNLMKAATQLLISPIVSFIPKIKEDDYNKRCGNGYRFLTPKELKMKRIVLYLSNLLYRITCDEYTFNLLIYSLKKNDVFLKEMELESNDLQNELFSDVLLVLKRAYKRNQPA